MKMTVRMLAVMLVGAGVVMAGSSPAFCEDTFCPMGGTMIQVQVDQEKIAEWVDREGKKAVVVDDPWTLTTLSDSTDAVALRFTATSIFFGVAGKDAREVDERLAEKTFGNNFRILRETVKKTMVELKKRGAVKIDGSDPQELSDAAGLGVLEKDGRSWKLVTENCEGTSIDASELK